MKDKNMRTCRKHIIRALFLLISAQALSAAPLLFDRKEYAARRGRLMDKIPDGIAVVLGASAPANDREFRQGHDFAYFTGVEIPDAYLIIDKIGTIGSTNQLNEIIFCNSVPCFTIENVIKSGLCPTFIMKTLKKEEWIDDTPPCIHIHPDEPLISCRYLVGRATPFRNLFSKKCVC